MKKYYPMFKRQTRTPSRGLLVAGLFFYLTTGLLGAAANEPEDTEAAGEDAESGIVIQEQNKDIIKEYRVNGELYMIRVTPEKGAPYYLVDADGDGELETRTNELAPTFLIPSWVIFSW